MKTRIAFAGFRHGHINSLYAQVKNRDDAEIVAGCEEDAATRETLRAGTDVQITHEDYEQMLDTVECDAIAVGDYYGKRGEIVIKALKREKHVICDKPLCTHLDELDEIEGLAKEKKLKVSMMLDMRDQSNFGRMRQLVLAGEIGEPHAISFGGQHPLTYGTRPGWYFEKGKHGG
ncbi:Gfo/Idh/MocA family protein, partial [Verrucomicrobiota bacterium]